MSITHRVVLGVCISGDSGMKGLAISPFYTHGLIETVFKRRPPNNLDVTLTVESEGRTSQILGRTELVTGPISMMEDALKALSTVGTHQENDDKNAEKDEREEKQLPGSFVQFGIGSKDFCLAFIRFWAQSIGSSSCRWNEPLLGRIQCAGPDDVIWVDVVNSPNEINKGNARSMVLANIGSLVM